MRFEFIESALFTKYVSDYLSDDEYARLQGHLCQYPDAGDLVKGSGGVRKLRWTRSGTGKSSGVRVCYYMRSGAGQILMLTIYAKSVRDSIPGHLLKAIKEALEHGKNV